MLHLAPITSVVLSLSTTYLVPQADLYVDADAVDCLNASGTPQAPFCTIQEAIDAAAPGARILVAAGTYLESLTVDQSCSIVGLEGPGATTVRAVSPGVVVDVTTLGPTCELEGLTITGGSGFQGGGVSSTSRDLVVRNCIVTNNTGDSQWQSATIWVRIGNLLLENSTVSDNDMLEDQGYNAAVYVAGYSSATIRNSTISGNTSPSSFASAVFTTDSPLVIENSTISGNEMGGLYFGYYCCFALSGRLERTTITGNHGGFRAGGIELYAFDLEVSDSIIAGNTSTFSEPDIGRRNSNGTFASLGHNLIGDGSTVPGFTNGVNGDLVGTSSSPIDAGLRPLASTGGTTMTHGLLPGSPALDAASGLRPGGFDQRGLPRPMGYVDMGAHEQSSGVAIPGCTAVPNSTGRAAELGLLLNPEAGANDATLSMFFLPSGTFGYFLTSQTQAITNQPGGSAGVLCLGGAIGRYVAPGQVLQSNEVGTATLALDLTSHPTPTGATAVMQGETWGFQGWFRDTMGGVPTSNFSAGASFMFL